MKVASTHSKYNLDKIIVVNQVYSNNFLPEKNDYNTCSNINSNAYFMKGAKIFTTLLPVLIRHSSKNQRT